MLPDDARPRPTRTHHEKDLSGEYLFYDHEGDRVHVLNGTAREIYLLCDGTRTLVAIARSLGSKYDVAEATALGDVSAVVAELAERGLLAV
jgi:Coenzyme PQQ synthesis protein D (PqqD)